MSDDVLEAGAAPSDPAPAEDDDHRGTPVTSAKLFLLALGAAAGAGVALAVYRHPLETALLLQRLRLRAHGFRPRERMTAGTPVSYWVGGDEESPVAICFLHDPFTASETWHGLLPRVARTFRVIAPDLPGFGRSPEPVDASIGYLARVVGSLLADEGVESAILVGSSLGGLVALDAALAHPGLVRGLVLADVLGLGGIPEPTWIVHEGRSDVDELLRRMYDAPPRIPGFVREEMVLRSQRPGVGVLLGDVSDAAARIAGSANGIAVPTLILWGDADGIAPIEHGERLNGLLSGSRLVRIRRCGHVPHREAPDVFYQELMDFLAGPTPDAAGEYEI